MRSRLRTGTRLGISFGCLGIILLFNCILGAVLWPYTINSWLVFAGKEAAIVWWHGALFAWVPGLGQLTIPAAFVTLILMLFLV